MNSRRCIAGHAPDALNLSVSDYPVKVQAVECPFRVASILPAASDFGLPSKADLVVRQPCQKSDREEAALKFVGEQASRKSSISRSRLRRTTGTSSNIGFSHH